MHKYCTASHTNRHCTTDRQHKRARERERAGERKRDKKGERERKRQRTKGIKTLNKWTDPQSFSPSICSSVAILFVEMVDIFFYFILPQLNGLFAEYFLRFALKCGHLFLAVFLVGCILCVRFFFLFVNADFCVHFVWRKICASFSCWFAAPQPFFLASVSVVFFFISFVSISIARCALQSMRPTFKMQTRTPKRKSNGSIATLLQIENNGLATRQRAIVE